MKKLFPISLVILLTVVLIFTGCAKSASNPSSVPTQSSSSTQATAPAPSQVIELSLNLQIPSVQPRWAGAILPWTQEVEKRTNGRVKIVPSFAGALSAPPDVYNSVVTGIADMAEGTVGISPPGQMPLWTTIGDCATGGFYTRGMDVMELYNKFPALQNEFKDVKMLFMEAAVPEEIASCKKPLNSPADS